ncbi:Hypothetical predicted protein, partial [Pelobates cultripes]
MIRGQQTRAQVPTLRTTRGHLTQFPEEIAEEFRAYYTTLYNIHADRPNELQDTTARETEQYLQGFQPE